MSTCVTEILCALQAAMVSRDLYDANHPATRGQLERAHALVRDRLATGRPLRLVFAEGQLIASDATERIDQSKLVSLLEALDSEAVDGLIFRPGVTSDEIDALIERLRGSTSSPTPHIVLGHVVENESGTLSPDELKFELLSTDADAASPWGRFVADGAVRTDLLGSVVAQITQAVQSSHGAMIPLASLKSHDEYTFTHSVNVGILASSLAEAVGLSGDRIHDLTIAAFLHDIGKCGVPEDILSKNDKLSAQERETIEVHPAFGAGLLLEQAGVPEIASVVAYEHHMRIDGGGYPYRKRPWQMHVASQIVQIADIFDALRSDRPYRAALTTPESVEVLEEMAGSAFDQELLTVFQQRVLSRLEDVSSDAAA